MEGGRRRSRGGKRMGRKWKKDEWKVVGGWVENGKRMSGRW